MPGIRPKRLPLTQTPAPFCTGRADEQKARQQVAPGTAGRQQLAPGTAGRVS